MTGRADPLDSFNDLGDAIDTALDEVLRAAQARMMNALETVTGALGALPDDEILVGFNQLEWQLLHVANIGTVANLARRRILVNPDKIAEITSEARLLVDWFRRNAAQPSESMGPQFIPRIGMHPDPDDTWTNMMNTMLGRRMNEDDGQGSD